MAWMMFSLAMRRLVTQIVTNEMARPVPAPIARLIGSITSGKLDPSSAPKIGTSDDRDEPSDAEPGDRAEPQRRRSRRTPPSIAKARMSRRRVNPTARSMPSSVLRSSASMTKRLISNRIPARTLKIPIMLKTSVRPAPWRSASSRTAALGASTSTPGTAATAVRRSAATVSDSARVSNTPPDERGQQDVLRRRGHHGAGARPAR